MAVSEQASARNEREPRANRPQRGRGRPRRGTLDSRARLLQAAREEFAERGFASATIRSIASRAGVDPALIHHYFGSKAGLFSEAIGTPAQVDEIMPDIVDGPLDSLGERIARHVFRIWENPHDRARGLAVMHFALRNDDMSMFTEYIRHEQVLPIAGVLPFPDAELRATTVAMHIFGVLMGRYFIRVPMLAEADPAELEARLAVTLQGILTDGSTGAAGSPGAGSPGAGNPDTEHPENGSSSTEARRTGNPEAGVPGPEGPGAESPGAGSSSPREPGAGNPGTGRPGAGVSGAEGADPGE